MSATAIDSFDTIDSPEHKEWRKHRDVLLRLPAVEAGYRSCIGLGLSVNPDAMTSGFCAGDADEFFLNDADVRWCALQDLPMGRFSDHPKREVHWATVRRTTKRFGMPCLSTQHIEQRWDFRDMPREAYQNVRKPADVLAPAQHPQYFRAFNAINWAMTSTAFKFRAAWRSEQAALCDALAMKAVKLAYGPVRIDRAPPAVRWFPRPYLGFKSMYLLPGVLWRAARGADKTYPAAILDGFVEFLIRGGRVEAPVPGTFLGWRQAYDGTTPVKVVGIKTKSGVQCWPISHMARSSSVYKGDKIKAGDVIGFDSPHDLDLKGRRHPDHIWAIIRERYGIHLDQAINWWWLRQGRQLVDGYVHFPAELCSLAAMRFAADSALIWECSGALNYFDEGSDTFVFPTIGIRRWNAWQGYLPRDMFYDLTPTDFRICGYSRA